MKVDFSRLPDWVNPGFYFLLWDRRRYNVVYGGAGAGKSYFQAQRVIYRTVAEKGHNTLCVRKVHSSNKFSTFQQILGVITDWSLEDVFKINRHDMVIKCNNGNEIRFVGLDDAMKLKSITFASGPLTDIWVEESTEITEEDFNQLNLRLRGQSPVGFQITLTFNPVSAIHWIRSRFCTTKRDDTVVYKVTYKDNAFIDKEYSAVLDDLKDVDKDYYAVYALGEWGVLTGLIFNNWKPMKSKYRRIDYDQILCGQDFGFNHKNAIELIGVKDGVLYSFDELWVSGLTNNEVISHVKDNGPFDRKQLCIADSAEPDRIKEWRTHGFNVRPARKGKHSLRYGIDYLRGREWYVDPERCPGLVNELYQYKWASLKDGTLLDQPVAFMDDAIAACRYATEPLWWKRHRHPLTFNRRKARI